jgi:predicted amidohydrolase
MVRALGDAARRHTVAVACGYLERCSGRVHDSALVVDERGCALANYRRTHLLADDRRQGLAPGQWLNLVPLGGVRIGILLGADLDAAEPARALALAGATALLLPADRPARSASITAALLRARAYENGLGVAFANLDDGAGCLASTIVGPDGTVLAEACDGIAVADLPVADRDVVDRLAARRPTLYRRLAEPHPAEPPLRG